jgi:hypothetical protein
MTQQIQTIPTLRWRIIGLGATVSRRTDQDAASDRSGDRRRISQNAKVNPHLGLVDAWMGSYSALLGSNVPWAAVLAVTAGCLSTERRRSDVHRLHSILLGQRSSTCCSPATGWAIFRSSS